MPPLNQSLWTLLIVLLGGLMGWGVAHMSAQIERRREAR